MNDHIYIAQIKDNCKQLGFGGWLEDWDIKNIFDEVGKLEAGQLYLEIGVARGQSMAVAHLAAKPGVRLKGIDLIDWQDRGKNLTEFLRLYHKQPEYEFIEGDSQEAAKNWQHGPIDVLFIDGDHSWDGVMKDMVSWIPWVKPGGVIMFDDYNDRTGVGLAIDFTIKNHQAFTDNKIDGEMFICRKK